MIGDHHKTIDLPIAYLYNSNDVNGEEIDFGEMSANSCITNLPYFL